MLTNRKPNCQARPHRRNAARRRTAGRQVAATSSRVCARSAVRGSGGGRGRPSEGRPEGESVGHRAASERVAWDYIEKDVPQPHELLAFGLSITKREPISSSA